MKPSCVIVWSLFVHSMQTDSVKPWIPFVTNVDICHGDVGPIYSWLPEYVFTHPASFKEHEVKSQLVWSEFLKKLSQPIPNFFEELSASNAKSETLRGLSAAASVAKHLVC